MQLIEAPSVVTASGTPPLNYSRSLGNLKYSRESHL